MSSAKIRHETEPAECRDCGVALDVPVMYVPQPDGSDRRIPPLAVMCAECDADDQAVQGQFSTSPQKPPDTMLDWLRAVGVNTRDHGLATLDSFDDSRSPRALREARQFVRDTIAAGPHDPVAGLYFVGDDKGAGKTHLAVGIMRAIHEARPDLTIVFDRVDRLITRVQDSYGTGTTDTLIETRAKADVWIADDLGREKGTADALRTLCTIFDERMKAPTVYTSNCTPRELAPRYSDDQMWARVASRLGDANLRYAEVSGPDRRFPMVEGAA